LRADSSEIPFFAVRPKAFFEGEGEEGSTVIEFYTSVLPSNGKSPSCSCMSTFVVEYGNAPVSCFLPDGPDG